MIDCPPNFNIVTKTAIIASDYILVPARPDYLSTLGIDYLLRSVRDLIKDYNDFADVKDGEKIEKIAPKVLGVVFTMIQEYGGQPMGAQRPFMNQVKNMRDISALFSNTLRGTTHCLLALLSSEYRSSFTDTIREAIKALWTDWKQ